jgi:hypothetical protein
MDRLHLEHRSQVIAYAGQMGLGPAELSDWPGEPAS